MNMMSSENQNPGNRKAASSRPQEQGLKCPRCDSPNTKFCYYNNYSLTQPRHFCKTCRRYWTKGGALRNVPIGGGCRKNKKMIKSKDSGSSSQIGGFNKLFHGLSPAMDFQLGGLSLDPLLNPSASSANHLMGFNYPLSSVAIQEMGSLNVNSSLASSIESLSSINQDLHWRWQRQRLGMLFGGENQRESSLASAHLEPQVQKPQPILFQNLEISKPEASSSALGNSRKEGASGESSATDQWFFGNSSTATTTNGGGNIHNTINNWNDAQAWSDLHRYSALP